MKPTRPERDHKNRWCFRCETWRDMEPWSDSWGGCRCSTCEYVAKVANPFFEALQCSVCGRPCEGVSDEKGRLGCSYECAYKLGHIPREIMVQYAGRKWQPARSNRDAPVIGATEPTPTTYTIGETEWAHRIATLEHMLAEERENVDTLRARVAELEGETSMLREQISVRIEDVSMFKRLYEEQIQDDNAARAELEAEVATLRHRDALLKRVHGALADMCCRVPTSIDEPVDHIVRLSLARANQRFVDEYDLRVSAQDWANDLRAELFDWQHAVEYVLGDNWCSADGHDAKAARKALAEWAEKTACRYEAIRLDNDGLHTAYMAALRDNSLDRGELLDERDAALREVAGAKRALADYDRACAQVSSLTVENAELKARITTLEAMKP